jgi:hypothetical protein
MVVLHHLLSKKNPLLSVDWPVAGILPSLVYNLHRLHDYIVVDLLAPSGHSLKVAVVSIRFFITCDPANIQHIFTSNHANYPKGEEFAEIFDVTRGSIFTVDGQLSRRQRANYQGVLSSPRLVGLMTKCCHDKVEKGFLPFMTHMARTGTPVDMADLMTRLVFDCMPRPSSVWTLLAYRSMIRRRCTSRTRWTRSWWWAFSGTLCLLLVGGG